jgi:3-hydroxy-3-methylglutaryl CoA synthase/uncharacterized OB-fold protein
MPHGITAYAAYVPRHRLALAEIADALGTTGARLPKGSRAVASYDEDSTTLGVEAARAALVGTPWQTGVPSDAEAPDVHFATTAPAYADKTNATAIHAALNLGHRGHAVDMVGSARSATAALRSARASGGLAVLADLRSGRAGSADERQGADAAAAFLFGPESDAAAVVLGEASATAEFLDRWRAPGAAASSGWEERFGLEQYVPLIVDAASRALSVAGVETPDHVLVSSPHVKAAAQATRRLAPKVDEPALGIGWAGAADLGVRLVAVLERAEPGQTVLAVNAVDGADATVLRVTDRIATRPDRPTVADQLGVARPIRYATFLSWRGRLERDVPRRPEPDRPAGPASARTEAWKFALVGSRSASGRIHLPPSRIDLDTGREGDMEPVSLAAKQATVATFTVDRLAYSPSPPMIETVVDFDGGGRFTFELADAGPEDVQIGTRVEMTFRRLYTSGGVHNYFWKARPLIAAGTGETA